MDSTSEHLDGERIGLIVVPFSQDELEALVQSQRFDNTSVSETQWD